MMKNLYNQDWQKIHQSAGVSMLLWDLKWNSHDSKIAFPTKKKSNNDQETKVSLNRAKKTLGILLLNN